MKLKLMLFVLLFTVGATLHAQTFPDWLQLKNNPLLDIRKYGATTGADCGAAINAAIDASLTSGGVVFIPDGDWPVTTSIVLKSGVSIIGNSKIGTRLVGGSNATIITFESGALTENVTMRDFTLYGGTTASAAYGIAGTRTDSNYANQFWIDNVKFENFSTAAVSLSYMYNWNFSNCTFVNVANGVAIGGAWTQTRFVNCEFSSIFGRTLSCGIDPVYSLGATGVSFSGCRFEHLGVSGGVFSSLDVFTFTEAEALVFDKCYFEDVGATGRYLLRISGGSGNSISGSIFVGLNIRIFADCDGFLAIGNSPRAGFPGGIQIVSTAFRQSIGLSAGAWSETNYDQTFTGFGYDYEYRKLISGLAPGTNNLILTISRTPPTPAAGTYSMSDLEIDAFTSGIAEGGQLFVNKQRLSIGILAEGLGVATPIAVLGSSTTYLSSTATGASVIYSIQPLTPDNNSLGLYVNPSCDSYSAALTHIRVRGITNHNNNPYLVK